MATLIKDAKVNKLFNNLPDTVKENYRKTGFHVIDAVIAFGDETVLVKRTSYGEAHTDCWRKHNGAWNLD